MNIKPLLLLYLLFISFAMGVGLAYIYCQHELTSHYKHDLQRLQEDSIFLVNHRCYNKLKK